MIGKLRRGYVSLKSSYATTSGTTVVVRITATQIYMVKWPSYIFGASFLLLQDTFLREYIGMKTFMNHYTGVLILIAVLVAILLVTSPKITQAKYSDDVASKETIVNKNKKGVVLIDRNGKSFFSFYDGKDKVYTPLSAISPHVQNAVIVAEDEKFYQHNGVSFNAIFGALIANFRKGDIAFGGSTITQQLVKNTLLDSKRNMFRKYEEFVLAREIEKRFSKKEILEMYLNSVYFGEGSYGIEEAASRYFGKRAVDLDISEASMLAGIIAAPSNLSPITGDTTKAKSRQQNVLEEMVEDKYITQDQKQAAQKDLSYTNGRKQEAFQAPHFALLVKEQLIKQYGEDNLAQSGMKVHTTLDLTAQSHTEHAVGEQVQKLAGNNGTNASVVVMDPKTGEVLTLVGSADWHNERFGKVNMAVAPRQPGSAFKPVVFLAGFEKQMVTPASILMDAPRKFENNYKPKNYDEKFRGPVSARYALANSLNVPSVELMTKVGTENTLEMAKRMGITTLKSSSDYGPSLVLGTGEVPLLELTNAYATLANQGEKHNPKFVSSIEDKYGKVIYKEQSVGEEAVDPKYVFLISSILSDRKIRSDVFGRELDISRPAAVKTGTTEYYKDAWTVGYTPNLTVGVWVGNNNNASMDKIAGSLGAAPIWKNVMEKLSAGTPVEEFSAPSGVIAHAVCANYGKRSYRGNSVNTEYFAEGTEPKGCIPSSGANFGLGEDLDKFLASLLDKEDYEQGQDSIGRSSQQEINLRRQRIEFFFPQRDTEKDGERRNGRGRGRED